MEVNIQSSPIRNEKFYFKDIIFLVKARPVLERSCLIVLTKNHLLDPRLRTRYIACMLTSSWKIRKKSGQ
jgi:hypothetical protein